MRLLLVLTFCLLAVEAHEAAAAETQTYARFRVQERDGKVIATDPILDDSPPTWAADVQQTPHDWTPIESCTPYFAEPLPYIIPPPEESNEPLYPHNHMASLSWLPNGDLMAAWYSTDLEKSKKLTVLAARLRAGGNQWDPASEFFKAQDRNMHGSLLHYDESTDTLHHINGMGPEGVDDFKELALMHRISRDNGVTWTAARPISTGSQYQGRHIPGPAMCRCSDGRLIVPCDTQAIHATFLHFSDDDGNSWRLAEGEILGVHAAVEELEDGRLMAFGRTFGGKRTCHNKVDHAPMPVSISADRGKSWNSADSPFPPIGSNQRPVLMRLREGPLLLISFTTLRDHQSTMPFEANDGKQYQAYGMFAAVSYDEGKTWPVRKLIAPEKSFADECWGISGRGRIHLDPTRAEVRAYTDAMQSPDGVIHLISCALHYRFNLKWLEMPPAIDE